MKLGPTVSLCLLFGNGPKDFIHYRKEIDPRNSFKRNIHPAPKQKNEKKTNITGAG